MHFQLCITVIGGWNVISDRRKKHQRGTNPSSCYTWQPGTHLFGEPWAASPTWPGPAPPPHTVRALSHQEVQGMEDMCHVSWKLWQLWWHPLGARLQLTQWMGEECREKPCLQSKVHIYLHCATRGRLGLLNGKPGGTILGLSFLEIVICLSLHQGMFVKTEIIKHTYSNSLYIIEFVFLFCFVFNISQFNENEFWNKI